MRKILVGLLQTGQSISNRIWTIKPTPTDNLMSTEAARAKCSFIMQDATCIVLCEAFEKKHYQIKFPPTSYYIHLADTPCDFGRFNVTQIYIVDTELSYLYQCQEICQANRDRMSPAHTFYQYRG